MMMEDTVRLGRLADDKGHNSEFYRFNFIVVVRFQEVPNFNFLRKLWYKQTVIASKNCVNFAGKTAITSPVKTVLNSPLRGKGNFAVVQTLCRQNPFPVFSIVLSSVFTYFASKT